MKNIITCLIACLGISCNNDDLLTPPVDGVEEVQCDNVKIILTNETDYDYEMLLVDDVEIGPLSRGASITYCQRTVLGYSEEYVMPFFKLETDKELHSTYEILCGTGLINIYEGTFAFTMTDVAPRQYNCILPICADAYVQLELTR